ncbi:MAG: hypothetical protein IKQ62_06845 [Bacteroidaceae bacterium]|nr:hypothetical protein [Bacteroidaceae bacterium]
MKRTYDEPMMEVHHLMGEELMAAATKIPVGGEGTPDANTRLTPKHTQDPSRELWGDM